MGCIAVKRGLSFADNRISRQANLAVAADAGTPYDGAATQTNEIYLADTFRVGKRDLKSQALSPNFPPF